METLRMAVLASPAQGTYNYFLTIYLLTTSYIYPELCFFPKGKCSFLLCESILYFLEELNWPDFLYFYPVTFLISQSFLSRNKSVKYGTAELH